MHRRDVEQHRVGRLRPQLLLEEQLEDVGERLQQAGGPGHGRAEPLLQPRGDLALGPDHACRRQQQRVEHHDDEGDLDDDDRVDGWHGQEALSAPRPVDGRASRRGHVQRPSRRRAPRIRARNCLIVVSTGVAAASPNAHSVLPAMLSATLRAGRCRVIVPSPRSILSSILKQPVAAFAARRALAARLVTVEVQQVLRRPHHARRVVHDDHAGRAEQRSRPSAARRSWRARRSDPAAGSGTDDPPGITAFSWRPFAMPPA